jgi:RNA polymerase sigma-70 factor (ECF subfamily)
VAGGDESSRTRSILYCVVPRDLADRLYEPLRQHFGEDPNVEVVVERRVGDRRVGRTRRAADETSRAREERRRIRSAAGRRVGDRRALGVPGPAPVSLPRKARRHADRLVFTERLEPSAQYLRDADSKRLVTRYQAGEQSVFGELYLRYFNQVYSYARIALSDHHEAEDVTQQVFVRALGALDRYELRQTTPFRGWLFSIARNVVVDAVKARSGVAFETPEHLDLLRRDEPAAGPDEASETLGWLTDREVAMFVERLPLPQRQVLVLRFMLDLPAEEIATIVGKSPSAVRQLQSRALQMLQRRLAAVGRTSPRSGPMPTWVRVKPMPVMVRRRFALAHARRRDANSVR